MVDLQQAIQELELEGIEQAGDIQKAFRRLAHLYHPDKNAEAGAVEKFRQILTAYEFCLEHADDVFTHFGKIRMPSPSPLATSATITGHDDIFDDIFGFSSTGRILGVHEPQIVWLSVKEFCLGSTQTGKYIAYESCRDCKGVGAAPGTHARICRHCFGQGQIVRTVGERRKRTDCPRCYGRGRDTPMPCAVCNGFGRLKSFHRQRVRFPRGMRPYELYALECQDLKTRRPAQIFVEPRVTHDKIFKIENYDLLCEYHMDVYRHKEERQVHLKTPLGVVLLRLPPVVRGGDVISCTGQGLFMDSAGTLRGDLRVRVRHKKDSWLKRIFGG